MFANDLHSLLISQTRCDFRDWGVCAMRNVGDKGFNGLSVILCIELYQTQ